MAAPYVSHVIERLTPTDVEAQKYMQYSPIPQEVFAVAQRGGYVADAPQSQWEAHALNPLFFQALGKALGWRSLDYTFGPKWIINAQRFYRLILTGGDTEKFWADLLH